MSGEFQGLQESPMAGAKKEPPGITHGSYNNHDKIEHLPRRQLRRPDTTPNRADFSALLFIQDRTAVSVSKIHTYSRISTVHKDYPSSDAMATESVTGVFL